MPLFEFTCKHCGQEFEELLRSTSAVSEVSCPVCKSSQVQRKISTFATRIVGGGSLGSSPSSVSSCNTGST